MAGKTSKPHKAIQSPRPLAQVAAQRPELSDIEMIWDKELAPELAAREAIRKRTVSRAISRTVLGVAVAIIPVLVLLILSFGPLGFLFPIAFLVGILVVAAISGLDWISVYSMKTGTKDLVLAAACRPFGFRYETLHPDLTGIDSLQALMARSKELTGGLTGQQVGEMKTIRTIFGDIPVTSNNSKGPPAPTPAYDVLSKAALLPSHDRRRFEDLIEGERAGAKFSLVEARLDTSGDNGSTVFKGILLHVEYPQRFSGRTLMARSGWWKRGKGAGDLKKVDLTSRELAEAFTVWSSDQVEARALLSPDRMERLIALERHFSGGKLRGLFDQGHMTLALEADNQFEAGSVFQPLVDPRRFSSALSELGLVCDLIDGFLTREWVQGRL